MAIQAQRRRAKIHTYGAFTAASVFDYDLINVESFRTSKRKRK